MEHIRFFFTQMMWKCCAQTFYKGDSKTRSSPRILLLTTLT